MNMVKQEMKGTINEFVSIYGLNVCNSVNFLSVFYGRIVHVYSSFESATLTYLVFCCLSVKYLVCQLWGKWIMWFKSSNKTAEFHSLKTAFALTGSSTLHNFNAKVNIFIPRGCNTLFYLWKRPIEFQHAWALDFACNKNVCSSSNECYWIFS